MLSNPEGPSETEFPVCPKFTRLGKFENNRAHSNMFYGLRIFPEFYPSSNPCGGDKRNAIKAEFRNFTSYKNGMKCAIATQVAPTLPLRVDRLFATCNRWQTMYAVLHSAAKWKQKHLSSLHEDTTIPMSSC
jgi:hypothetical protein